MSSDIDHRHLRADNGAILNSSTLNEQKVDEAISSAASPLPYHQSSSSDSSVRSKPSAKAGVENDGDNHSDDDGCPGEKSIIVDSVAPPDDDGPSDANLTNASQ
eukprot:scaffold39870_cov27-Prasinocladus_malaysianus.AAC.1